MNQYEQLTEREQNILLMISQGLTNRAIADELILALGTVKWYNSQIYSKLGVSNRAQAVAQAQELGIFENGRVFVADTPHNLPAQLTPFVGRRQELHDVTGLLNAVRLVTITGPGGIGKTRLAQEFVMPQLYKFPDGIFFVSLASVDESGNVLWAIAETLEIQFRGVDDPLQQLLDYLKQKSILLILDNFEHLLAGTDIIVKILKATDRVRIIVTSRERLHLYGEVTYAIGGLTLPEDDNVEESAQSDAIDLFIHRATAILPVLNLSADELRQVGQLCVLVEGMPLAIELAATWIDSLLLSDIISEIKHSLNILQAERRDTHHSHSSMRAVFLRSWNLLDTQQQHAFRRLAVFRGGFDRAASQGVTKVTIQTLRSLVNKSLLRHDPTTGRYELHELLRYFAQENLEASGEATALYDAHATYFTEFIEEQWEQTKGPQQLEALHTIETNIENVRAAWNYRLNAAQISELQKFFHGLWVIYDVRGWYPAGIQLFEQAITMMRQTASPSASIGLGRCLAIQGMFIMASGWASRHAYDLASQGVDILREHGHTLLRIIPLISLSATARQVGETDIAVQAANECLKIALDIEDQWGIIKAKQLLALQAIEDKDYDLAETLGDQALAICDMRQDHWSASVVAIEVMGTIAILRQQYQIANSWVFHGLNAAELIDFKYVMQVAYFQLGYIAVLQNNYLEAGRYWHKAIAVGEKLLGGLVITGFYGISSTGDYQQFSF